MTNAEDIDYIIEANEFAIKKDHHGAITVLSKGIEKHPENGELYAMRGVHYHLICKYEEALKDHIKAIELTTDEFLLAGMYANKAITYSALNQTVSADSDFQKAISYETPWYIPQLEYGKFLLAQGRKAEAIKYLEIAKDNLAKTGPENFFEEAEALFKANVQK
ncbi:MAG: hypothetical protein KIT34_05395 [Cyanobacteria bacterium TGS_CYA1]|nr:hypothetical protein [Cyanobacteria bacterium TGS_CYA1]